MSDILHARVMSFNLPRAILFGYKPTKLDRMIGWRSDHKHTELQMSTRYGGISFSCTMADGVGGCRFKLIKYSHPEYWDEVYVPVTVEQEAKMYGQACGMADIDGELLQTYLSGDGYESKDIVHYGDNHVKYDRAGAAFSYWTKWDIYKPHKTKMVCCRACCDVILAGYPDLMDIGGKQVDFTSFTPSECDSMLRNYFSTEGILSRVEPEFKKG